MDSKTYDECLEEALDDLFPMVEKHIRSYSTQMLPSRRNDRVYKLVDKWNRDIKNRLCLYCDDITESMVKQLKL